MHGVWIGHDYTCISICIRIDSMLVVLHVLIIPKLANFILNIHMFICTCLYHMKCVMYPVKDLCSLLPSSPDQFHIVFMYSVHAWTKIYAHDNNFAWLLLLLLVVYYFSFLGCSSSQ